MEWFFYAIGAPFLWAIVNIADKFLVNDTSETENPIGALVIFSSLAGFVVMIASVFITDGIFVMSLRDKMILILSGLTNAIWIILYLYALENDEVSSVAPWFLTIPVFSYVLGYLILGETMTNTQLIGGLFILIGSAVFSVDFKDKIKIKWKTISLMVPVAILGALWGVLFKFVAQDSGFWASSFWEYAGLAIAGVLIFVFVKKYRIGFLEMIKKSGRKIISINLSSEIITIIANLLNNFALLLAPVTMVYLVSTFQPVFVLIFAVLATIFFPKILKEDISRNSLVPKIIALVIMIFGSYLLF